MFYSYWKFLFKDIIFLFCALFIQLLYWKRVCNIVDWQFVLDVLGNKAGSVFRSGSVPLTRPLSSGKQTYDTIPIEWPLTQPMTKVEAINQVGLFYVPLKKHRGILLPNVGLLSSLASNKNWNSLLGSKLLSHCETCGRGDRTSLSLFTCM